MEVEEVLQSLRAAGYAADHGNTHATKKALGKLVTPETSQFWHAVSHILAKTARDRHGDAGPQPLVLPATGDLARELQEQNNKNAKLQDMIRMQQERANARSKEMLLIQAQLSKMQQTLRNYEMQLLVLSSMEARHAQLLPLLDQHIQYLEQLTAFARSRAAATSIPGSQAVALDQLCGHIQQTMREHADGWLAANQDDSLSVSSSGSSHLATTGHKPILHLPPDHETQVAAWNKLQPTTMLTHMIKVLQRQTEVLQQLCVRCEGGGAAAGHQAHSSGAHMWEALQKKQQAHWSKFVSCESQQHQAQAARTELAQLSQAAGRLLAWPYNTHKLQEACLLAELDTMKREAERLRCELQAGQAAEGRVQELFRANQAAGLREQQLSRLISRLMGERHEVVSRWSEEVHTCQDWTHHRLPTACQALAASLQRSKDVLLLECEAAAPAQAMAQGYRLVNTTSSAPAPTSNTNTGITAIGSGKPLVTSGGDVTGAGGRSQPLTHTPLPTIQLMAQGSAVLATAGAVKAAGTTSLQLTATPGTPQEAAGGGGGGGGGAQPVQQVQLHAALRAAAAMDWLAGVRCPGALLYNIKDHQARFRSFSIWVTQAQFWCDATRDMLKQQASRQVHTCERLSQARQQDLHRCEAMQHFVERVRDALLAMDTTIRPNLEDFKNVPSLHLLPDVQFAGLNVMEWLTVLRELYAGIQQADNKADGRQ